jgi:hypothetical protein
MPNFSERTPVKKGSAAEPVVPMPATQDTAPVKSQRGSTCAMWLIRMGYIGPVGPLSKYVSFPKNVELPSKRPMNATATAFSIRDGTTHTVTCRAMTPDTYRYIARLSPI